MADKENITILAQSRWNPAFEWKNGSDTPLNATNLNMLNNAITTVVSALDDVGTLLQQDQNDKTKNVYRVNFAKSAEQATQAEIAKKAVNPEDSSKSYNIYSSLDTLFTRDFVKTSPTTTASLQELPTGNRLISETFLAPVQVWINQLQFKGLGSFMMDSNNSLVSQYLLEEVMVHDANGSKSLAHRIIDGFFQHEYLTSYGLVNDVVVIDGNEDRYGLLETVAEPDLLLATSSYVDAKNKILTDSIKDLQVKGGVTKVIMNTDAGLEEEYPIVDAGNSLILNSLVELSNVSTHFEYKENTGWTLVQGYASTERAGVIKPEEDTFTVKDEGVLSLNPLSALCLKKNSVYLNNFSRDGTTFNTTTVQQKRYLEIRAHGPLSINVQDEEYNCNSSRVDLKAKDFNVAYPGSSNASVTFTPFSEDTVDLITGNVGLVSVQYLNAVVETLNNRITELEDALTLKSLTNESTGA